MVVSGSLGLRQVKDIVDRSDRPNVFKSVIVAIESKPHDLKDGSGDVLVGDQSSKFWCAWRSLI
jgi:hypothetical protein